ncbi:MAG: hypothetical protein IIV57_05645 [Bacteroidaceae bacterium]|nr:hypothetical protein [Bacteroidaceae bacterium]
MSKNQLHTQVENLLYEGRLKQAIRELSEAINSETDWELYTRLSEVETAYRYMLEYLQQGMPDPNREALHCELIGRCLTINDEYRLLQLLITERYSLFAQKRHIYRGEIATEEMRLRMIENRANIETVKMTPYPERRSVEMELMQQHEKLLQEAFYRLYAKIGWQAHDRKEVITLLTEKEIPVIDRATLIGAIVLSLLQSFEPQKALILCNLSTNDETIISTRALIGLIIVLTTHTKRLKYYPELIQAVETLRDTPDVMRRIGTIQIQLLRCRETQKIDRKMREEIIPAMMKNPNMRSGEKLGVDFIKELEEEGQNPEWKAWVEEGEIKDKLDEMAKWQIEGADVYMSTFSQLKRFPFFNETSNWMRPFDKNVPQIAELMPDNSTNRKTLLDAICSSRFFCNSDKYSFCFTFGQVPQEQREMLTQQMPEGADSGPEPISKAPKEQESEILGNQYIQDLYRFFKLSIYKKEFVDPFTQSLNLLSEAILQPLMENSEAILHTFHYLVEKEYYSEAIEAGRILEERETKSKCDAQFYQKLGYCLQKECDYSAAIDSYTKADILQPDSLWTMRHIAQCYRLMGNFEDALHYYIAAEEVAPENLTLLLQTGECLAILKRYEEAFARFFKVEYLDTNSHRATRAIAWCSFLTAKDEQAQRYYDRLLQQEKVRHEDYINAAHVQWIAGNRSKAVELYKKAASMCSKEQFEQQMKHDEKILIERGASQFELMLLKEIIE